MRAVLDTNVLVSALISRGSPPDTILRAWLKGAFELVTSAPLIRELNEVLERPAIVKRLGPAAQERTSFLAALSASAIVVAPEEELHVVKADPADNRVLEAAVRVQVDYIVSGDHDLLELGSFEGIPIVTPARFVAILAERSSQGFTSSD